MAETNGKLSSEEDLKRNRRDVLMIAWPVLLELVLGTMYGMADMIMISRMPNAKEAAAAVAGIGITNQPVLLGMAVVQSLNIGGTALIARATGAKDNKRISNTFYHMIILNVILVIPISIITILNSTSIMAFLGAEQETISVSENFFKIIMFGFIFQSITTACTAALRGAGDTKTPMKINIFSNVLNLIGDFFLIYGFLFFPVLGATGAAISTVFSQFVGCSIMIYTLFNGKKSIKLEFKMKFKFNKNLMKNLIRIGIPSSGEQLAMRLGMLFFAKTVASLGTVIFATHQICLNILGLSFNPGQAFGIANSTLMGKSLGEGNPDKAEKYGKEARKIGSIIASIIGAIFFFFGKEIVSLYTLDPEIIKHASMALKIIGVIQPFQSSQLIISGGLRGAGDTIWPLIGTLIGVVLVRTSLAYLFVSVLGFGLSGAWAAVFVDQILRWGIIYTRFRIGKWKNIKIL